MQNLFILFTFALPLWGCKCTVNLADSYVSHLGTQSTVAWAPLSPAYGKLPVSFTKNVADLKSVLASQYFSIDFGVLWSRLIEVNSFVLDNTIGLFL